MILPENIFLKIEKLVHIFDSVCANSVQQILLFQILSTPSLFLLPCSFAWSILLFCIMVLILLAYTCWALVPLYRQHFAVSFM